MWKKVKEIDLLLPRFLSKHVCVCVCVCVCVLLTR